MIDYERIAKEIAKNITGIAEDEMIELFNDENYSMDHLVPESYELSEDGDEFNFSISDIHWFNDYESGEEWVEGEDKFDGDKLAEALEKVIPAIEYIDCDDEYFTVGL